MELEVVATDTDSKRGTTIENEGAAVVGRGLGRNEGAILFTRKLYEGVGIIVGDIVGTALG
jgi:hypothetical protein